MSISKNVPQEVKDVLTSVGLDGERLDLLGACVHAIAGVLAPIFPDAPDMILRAAVYCMLLDPADGAMPLFLAVQSTVKRVMLAKASYEGGTLYAVIIRLQGTEEKIRVPLKLTESMWPSSNTPGMLTNEDGAAIVLYPRNEGCESMHVRGTLCPMCEDTGRVKVLFSEGREIRTKLLAVGKKMQEEGKFNPTAPEGLGFHPAFNGDPQKFQDRVNEAMGLDKDDAALFCEAGLAAVDLLHKMLPTLSRENLESAVIALLFGIDSPNTKGLQQLHDLVENIDLVQDRNEGEVKHYVVVTLGSPMNRMGKRQIYIETWPKGKPGEFQGNGYSIYALYPYVQECGCMDDPGMQGKRCTICEGTKKVIAYFYREDAAQRATKAMDF